MLGPTRETLTRSLVERGSWLFVGDSLSGHHFDSLTFFLSNNTYWTKDPELPMTHTHRLLSQIHPLSATMTNLPGGLERPLLTKMFSRFLLSLDEVSPFFPQPTSFNDLMDAEKLTWDPFLTPSLEGILKDFSKEGSLSRVLILATGPWWNRPLGGGIDSRQDPQLEVFRPAMAKAIDLLVKYVRPDQRVYIRLALVLFPLPRLLF